jgi:2-oxoglutarate dehydrogenase E2 component (dihydrolipoamide succinyltransferase)
MATDIIMPQMGESIFEGTITKWLKKVGDAVEKDEPLFEISTDKVDAEIPSPVAGVLQEIKVHEGATVQVNTIVASVSAAGETAATPPAESKSAKKSPAKPATQPAPSAKPEAAAPATAISSAAAQPDAGTSPPATGGTKVVMPQMGESIFEGTITKWLKKVGETVAKDEPLFEISTDKVDAEIPSPIAGVISEIKAAEGATVQINTVVAVIGGDAPTPAANDAPTAASEAASEPAPSVEPELPEDAVGQDEVGEAGVPNGKLRSSPLVRRIARENNLNLSRIPGTGAGGRITKEDALKYMSQQGQRASRATPESKAAAPSTPGVGPLQLPPVSPLAGQLVPLTKMRSIIAQRMVESTKISPHVHTVFKIDMTRIAKLREREKANYEQRNGVKLTYMPFIAAAAVHTLRKFPIVNASLESLPDGSGSAIRYHQNINLGIAVALDWGLIVPVIKQAEERSFLGLARAVADLAERARTKKLKPDEVSGSTFTLTNSGIFGEEFGTPIINQPDSAILAIGGLKKEAVVLTDAEGNDTIAIRWMQHFCLGFDHRTIDGADAGKFMAEFKKVLENWSSDIG